MITDARQDRQQSADLDEQRLDHGGRPFANSFTRRRACRALGGGTLGALLAGLGLSDVLARCNGVGERCRRNSQCCSGRCRRRKCRRAKGGTKPGGTEPSGPQADPPPPLDLDLPDYDLPALPTEERRKVAISGTIDITDDETFGGDEVCRHRVDEFYLDDFRGVSLFGGYSVFDTVQFSRGCGGEVRVEIQVTARLRSNGDVSISGQVKLYEGTSEGTSDLDGRENLSSFDLPKGGVATKTVTVHNEDEGGDHATVRLTFRNVAA